MDINGILESIDQYISKLQQARSLLTSDIAPAAPAVVAGKRRGRPKGSANKKPVTLPSAAKTAGKRTMSAEGKARIAAAQKARWAAQKKSVKPVKPAVKKIAATVAKKTASATKKAVSVKPAVAATTEA